MVWLPIGPVAQVTLTGHTVEADNNGNKNDGAGVVNGNGQVDDDDKLRSKHGDMVAGG